VLVIDNAAGSGVVIDGEPLLAALVRAAGQVLDRATLSDRVWLIAADGVARAGTAAELHRHLAVLRTQPVRLDLGRAIGAGRDLIRSSKRPGQVVVVSGLQRSTLGAARGDGNLLVVRATGAPPANRGIMTLSAGLQPWSAAGGRVSITIVSSDTAPVPVTLSVGSLALRDVLVMPGAVSVQRIGPEPPGWLVVTATLPPDEFRLDDARSIAVRVAPPVAVRWDSSDRYIDAAARVLAADGRIRAGDGVQLGRLGPGPGIVMPPSDPALVGALNRSLAARGIGWHFGSMIVQSAQIDSGSTLPAPQALSKRYALERGDGSGEVLATVGGAPWLVHAGNLLLLGSRLDPSWTALPLSASFVPFVDAMLTSTLAGTAIVSDAIAGDPLRLPDGVTAVAHDSGRAPVATRSEWTPRATGVFHLLSGTDTLGAVSVRLDPRESDLSRATDRDVRALWPGAIVAGLRDGPALTFGAGGRSDLRGALLALALLCALAETVLAGRVPARSSGRSRN
ncbi:MAG: hypothetical protein ACRELE_04460, partial [Gemmatimonadales bacterium]